MRKILPLILLSLLFSTSVSAEEIDTETDVSNMMLEAIELDINKKDPSKIVKSQEEKLYDQKLTEAINKLRKEYNLNSKGN